MDDGIDNNNSNIRYVEPKKRYYEINLYILVMKHMI